MSSKYGQYASRVQKVLEEVPKKLLIDGRWQEAEANESFLVLDPATTKPIASVADGRGADALKAMQTAVDRQAVWGKTPAQDRSDILYRAWDTVMRRREDLALLMSLEMGKPLSESMGEVVYSAKYLKWFAEEAVRIYGSHTLHPDGRGQILTTKEPVGPALLITPWNFPLAMGARKLGPAIAAGCTIVFKPARQTPLSSLMLAAILQEAGLPDGVLNLVPSTRADEISRPLLASGQIRKLSFTGSTRIGSLLLEQAAKHVVRASMELGGNAPFIVFEDADLDRAVAGAVIAKMRNMGQACTAANRIYVQRPIIEEFTQKLAKKITPIPLGDFSQPQAQIGPLIDESALKKISRLVDEALNSGAKRFVGKNSDLPGYFYPPTLLTDIPKHCQILKEEIFGPVAPVIAFDTEEEVIAMANDTDAGLVAYLYTRNLDRSTRVSRALQSGMVGINTGMVSEVAADFGGVKTSGLGREGGRLGIDEYLNDKYISIADG